MQPAFGISVRLLLPVLAMLASSAPVRAQTAEDSPLAAAVSDAAPAKVSCGQARAETHNGVTFRIKPCEEDWQGSPGYQAKIDYAEMESAAFPQVKDIAAYINGGIIGALFDMRLEVLSEQSPRACSDTQNASVKDAASVCLYQLSKSLRDVYSVGSLVSVHYTAADALAGMWSSYMTEQTYNFSLKPLFRIKTLPDIFADSDAALTLIQDYIRKDLGAQGSVSAAAPAAGQDRMEQATADWTLFDNFAFTKDGIIIFFAPGTVSDEVFGERTVTVPYEKMESYMTPFYRNALGLDK